jgi:hypothetical protein
MLNVRGRRILKTLWNENVTVYRRDMNGDKNS